MFVLVENQWQLHGISKLTLIKPIGLESVASAHLLETGFHHNVGTCKQKTRANLFLQLDDVYVHLSANRTSLTRQTFYSYHRTAAASVFSLQLIRPYSVDIYVRVARIDG